MVFALGNWQAAGEGCTGESIQIDRKGQLIPKNHQKHIILDNTILPVLTGLTGRPNESEVIREIQVLNLQTIEIRC